MKKIINWFKNLFNKDTAEYEPKLDPDQKWYEARSARYKKLDKILDKISQSGIESLNQNEKNFLDNFRG
jgi:hypothetical protein